MPRKQITLYHGVALAYKLVIISKVRRRWRRIGSRLCGTSEKNWRPARRRARLTVAAAIDDVRGYASSDTPSCRSSIFFSRHRPRSTDNTVSIVFKFDGRLPPVAKSPSVDDAPATVPRFYAGSRRSSAAVRPKRVRTDRVRRCVFGSTKERRIRQKPKSIYPSTS